MRNAFLSREELKEMTERTQRAAIIRNLKEQGVPFHISADGWPRVPWSYFEQQGVVRLRRDEREPNLDELETGT